MGCRYQQPTDKESEVSFRVVEIFVIDKNRERGGKSSRFLLVDNGHETLEMVQKEMQNFVRNAILANSLGKRDSMDRMCMNI